VNRWSDRYNWQARVQQHDAELAAAAREAVKQEAIRRSKERLKKADTLQGVGVGVIALADIRGYSPQRQSNALDYHAMSTSAP